MAYTYPEHKSKSSARKRKFGSGDRPLGQHRVAETEEFGRPPAGVGGDCAGFLNEFLLLDQAAEVLLVERAGLPALQRSVAVAAA